MCSGRCLPRRASKPRPATTPRKPPVSPRLRFLLGLLLLLALPVQGFAGVAVRLCGTAQVQAHDHAAHPATTGLAATPHTGHDQIHPAATAHAASHAAADHAATPPTSLSTAADHAHTAPLSAPPCCDDSPSCGGCCPALTLSGLPTLPTLVWTQTWHRPTESTPPSAFVPPQHRPPTA